MALLGLLRRVGVFLFFLLLVRETAGTSADGTPTMSPTVQAAGNETLEFPSCRGDEKFDERVTDFFFREGCLLRRNSHAGDACPVDTINAFMSNFVDAVRFESIFLDVASVLLFICIGCAGGIPNPANGIAGLLLFVAWMFMLLLQWFAMFSSTLMVVFAFFSMRSQYEHCLVDMSNGYKLIGVVAGLTFPLQPVFLAKQAVMLVYFLLMIQGLKVWRAMFQGGDDMDSGSASISFWASLCSMDGALAVYLGAFLLFNGAFVVAWLLSLSVTVGLVFFIPLTLVIAAVVIAIVGLLFAFAAYVIGDADFKESIFIVRLPMESLKSMVGWIGVFNQENSGDKAGTFGNPILACIALMALSPLVVYSTWLMMFIYAGNPTHEVMDLLALEYKHCFAMFRGVRFQLPSFEFSLTNAFGALSGFADLTSFAQFDPSHFVGASLALTALNLLISLIKPLLCGLSAALGAFGMTASQAANIPLAVVAVCEVDEIEEIRKFVAKAETELAVSSAKEVELSVGA